MIEITASELRSKCYAILDKLGPGGILITKKGKPVATLYRVGATCHPLIGKLKGRIQIKGDIFSTKVW